MKLCVTSSGKEIEAAIDTRFGRAPYFLIIDTDTGAAEAVENSAADQGQGAGIAAAQLIMDKGVDGVLTGRVGPNVLTAFRTSGIRLFEGASPEDTVKEALARFRRGEWSQSPASSEAVSREQASGRGVGPGMGRRGGQRRGMGGGRGRRRQG